MLQSPLGVMMGYNNEPPFTSPPPAHMGIPPVTIDPKTGIVNIQIISSSYNYNAVKSFSAEFSTR